MLRTTLIEPFLGVSSLRVGGLQVSNDLISPVSIVQLNQLELTQWISCNRIVLLTSYAKKKYGGK